MDGMDMGGMGMMDDDMGDMNTMGPSGPIKVRGSTISSAAMGCMQTRSDT
jgi:hypothetical protein